MRWLGATVSDIHSEESHQVPHHGQYENGDDGVTAQLGGQACGHYHEQADKPLRPGLQGQHVWGDRLGEAGPLGIKSTKRRNGWRVGGGGVQKREENHAYNQKKELSISRSKAHILRQFDFHFSNSGLLLHVELVILFCISVLSCYSNHK